jgi:hypothetical protein
MVIPAGARYDVLVQGPKAGVSELRTLPYNSGKAGNQFPEATLATVQSGGEPMRPAVLPRAFAPVDDLAKEPVAARKTVTFTENKAGTLFYINHKQFDHNRIDFRAKLHTVQEWTIKNDSDEVHSFHIHTNDFQVMSINGKPQVNYGLRDTVDVPPRGNMVVRIRFLDYPGKTVLQPRGRGGDGGTPDRQVGAPLLSHRASHSGPRTKDRPCARAGVVRDHLSGMGRTVRICCACPTGPLRSCRTVLVRP